MAKRKQASEQAPVTPGETAPELPKAGIKAKEKSADTSAETARKRGPGRPFQKGQSGNPGGRPKVPDEVKAMLKSAAPEAVRLLIETIGNENAAMNHRLDAAKEVLNRVYGKSTQPIDGEVDAVLQILFSDEAEEYAK